MRVRHRYSVVSPEHRRRGPNNARSFCMRDSRPSAFIRGVGVFMWSEAGMAQEEGAGAIGAPAPRAVFDQPWLVGEAGPVAGEDPPFLRAEMALCWWLFQKARAAVARASAASTGVLRGAGT